MCARDERVGVDCRQKLVMLLSTSAHLLSTKNSDPPHACASPAAIAATMSAPRALCALQPLVRAARLRVGARLAREPPRMPHMHPHARAAAAVPPPVRLGAAGRRLHTCCAGVAGGGSGDSRKAHVVGRGGSKPDRILAKLASKAARWAGKLPQGPLGAASKWAPAGGDSDSSAAATTVSRPTWKEYSRGAVTGLDCSLLGGNLTLVVDPVATRGRCLVCNMGEHRFHPTMELRKGGVLAVTHTHGLRAYAGQSEPVHTVVYLPAAPPGLTRLHLKLGEVWVFAAGLPGTPAGAFGGRDLGSFHDLDVSVALGDAQLHDVAGAAKLN